MLVVAGMLGATSAVMLIVTVVEPAEFVTTTSNDALPAVVGVPVNVPVLIPRLVDQLGIGVLGETAKVIGVAPPLGVMVYEFDAPTRQFKLIGEDTTGVDWMVMVTVVVELPPALVAVTSKV